MSGEQLAHAHRGDAHEKPFGIGTSAQYKCQ